MAREVASSTLTEAGKQDMEEAGSWRQTANKPPWLSGNMGSWAPLSTMMRQEAAFINTRGSGPGLANNREMMLGAVGVGPREGQDDSIGDNSWAGSGMGAGVYRGRPGIVNQTMQIAVQLRSYKRPGGSVNSAQYNPLFLPKVLAARSSPCMSESFVLKRSPPDVTLTFRGLHFSQFVIIFSVFPSS